MVRKIEVICRTSSSKSQKVSTLRPKGERTFRVRAQRPNSGHLSQLISALNTISYLILSECLSTSCWYMTFVIYLSFPRLSFFFSFHWYMTFVIYLSFPLLSFFDIWLSSYIFRFPSCRFFHFISLHLVSHKIAMGLTINNFLSFHQIPMLLYIFGILGAFCVQPYTRIKTLM